MSVTDWLGNFLGVEGGIDKIQSGYAGLIGLIVVMLGWWVQGRRETRRFRIERANKTIIMEEAELTKPMKLLSPYLQRHKSFPTFKELERLPELSDAIRDVLKFLEVLALDIGTGRASELYVKLAQREMINRICISSQGCIVAIRAAGQTGAFKQLENLFIRFYMNRSPYFQWIVEYIYGRPIYRYSYLVFRLRYLLAVSIWGLNPDFRKEDWMKIGEAMRKIRRTMDVLGYSAIALGVFYWIVK